MLKTLLNFFEHKEIQAEVILFYPFLFSSFFFFFLFSCGNLFLTDVRIRQCMTAGIDCGLFGLAVAVHESEYIVI